MKAMRIVLKVLVLLAVAALGWTLADVYRNFGAPPASSPALSIVPEILPQADVLAQLSEDRVWMFQGQPWQMTVESIPRASLEDRMRAPIEPPAPGVAGGSDDTLIEMLQQLKPQVREEGSTLHYVVEREGFRLHAIADRSQGRPCLRVARFAALDATEVTRLIEVRPRKVDGPLPASTGPRLQGDCSPKVSGYTTDGKLSLEVLECPRELGATIEVWKSEGWQVEVPDWAPKTQTYHLCRKEGTAYLAWQVSPATQQPATLLVSRVP